MSFYDGLGSSGDPFASVNEYGGVDFSAMNKGVTPVFFTVPVPDPAATEAAGAPRFREEEQVRILVAGDMLNQMVSPVTEELKQRFSEQYERWRANKKDRHIDGTPLTAWPLLTPVQVKEFEALNIFSVEQLAAVADSNINRLNDGRVWRTKAEAFLAVSKDSAVATKYAAENERLRGDMDAMKGLMEEMQAQIEKLNTDAAKPARRQG